MKPKNNLHHLFSAALADFKRNKVRTLLTSLGIMIGVFSVIMLIALGLGLKNYIQDQFEGLGTNLIIVFPGNAFSEEGGLSNFGPGFAGGADFDEKDLVNLRKISLLEYIVPGFFKSTIIKAGKEKNTGYIMGVNHEYFPAMNLEIIAGQAFTEKHNRQRSKIGVIGYTLAENLFDDPLRALGETVQFNRQRIKIIGVAEKTGDREQDTSILMPYKSTFGTLNPDKTFMFLYLGVHDEANVDLAQEKVKQTLLKRYDEEDFSVTEQTELLSAINQIFNIINSILIAIGSISLLVGGIGIMNIMYASVTERTKEVGIRRAIGATQKDILLQFLTESTILSLIGGLLGLLLATLIVIAIHKLFPASINLLAVIIALTVSSVIGIFFGVFPARRAAKLSPIEAIRYE